MEEVVLDFETRSKLDLRKVGAARYAQDPSTEVLCLSYAVDDAPPQTWAPSLGKKMPPELEEAVRSGIRLVGHACFFEQMIWKHVMARRYNWPEPPVEQWHDTQASCAYKGIPLKLEGAGAALELAEQKDMAGNRLLGQVSKPNKKTGKFNEDFDKLQKTMDYCAQDVRTERGLLRRVGYLPPEERQLWVLDQHINRRGVRFDRALIGSALKIVAEVEDRLTRELRDTTKGAVETHNQIEGLLKFLAGAGCPVMDLTADTVAAALDRPGLPPVAQRVLEIRQILAKAGAKKLDAMLRCMDPQTDRVCGLLQYHGATTGRWAGRLIQPQNFQRPEEEFEKLDIEQLCRDIRGEDVEFCDMVYGDAMALVTNAMRGTIIAAEGCDLGAGDFNQVEARVLVCLSGDKWKVDAFRDPTFDPYCTFAGFIYGHPVNKKEHPVKRTNGKIGELAFGYQGGVGAWRGFEDYKTTKKYGRRTDEEVNAFKDKWRELHPGVKALWAGLEDAAISAVATGKPQSYNGIEYRMNGDWLNCRLPSSRLLWYFKPQLVETSVPWSDTDTRLQLTYKAQRYGQWRTVHSYGGMLTENVVQAISRDLMVPAMFKCERAGYPVILTVHDEIVTEPLRGAGKAGVMEEIMADVPPWAAGWPIKAGAWVGPRYHKD